MDLMRINLEDSAVGTGTFGASAPAGVLFKPFGITPKNVVAALKAEREKRRCAPNIAHQKY